MIRFEHNLIWKGSVIKIEGNEPLARNSSLPCGLIGWCYRMAETRYGVEGDELRRVRE